MTGRNTFRDLTKGFSPERRARVDARKAELRVAMPLHELRQARALTQKALGEALNVNQPAVAKLERRTDMYVSKLRAYVEAMGGELSIVARFPQGDVAITNFADEGENFRSSRELTKEQNADIEALSELPEEKIDTTDIPEILDWSGAERGRLYRPVKRQITLRLDADIVAWFRANAPDGRGYQTEINRVLREHARQVLDEA